MRNRKLGEFVIDGARQLCLKSVAHEQARRKRASGFHDRERMVGTKDHGVAAVEAERDPLALPFALTLHLERPKRRRFNLDIEFFDWGDENVATVRLAPEDRREEPDHRLPADRRPLVIPGAVTRDSHPRMAAAFGIPAFDRRQGALVDQPLQVVQADSLKLDGGSCLGHLRKVIGLLRGAAQGRSSPTMTKETAIVTGAAKRLGAAITRALLEDGWAVIAHVHHDGDEVAGGATKIVADLADEGSADLIFAAAVDHPPVRLLVNNAARFAFDGFGEFSPAEFHAHMAVNVCAPALLIDRFARLEESEDSLVVNLLDAKLTAPNPDFLSYSLSKNALFALTDLAARALAPRLIRVNGIAPALMFRSSGQSEENFEVMHAANPLRRGVEPDDVIGALRYLIDAKAVTGQVITIDSGQRFMGLARDVQFLGGE